GGRQPLPMDMPRATASPSSMPVRRTSTPARRTRPHRPGPARWPGRTGRALAQGTPNCAFPRSTCLGGRAGTHQGSWSCDAVAATRSSRPREVEAAEPRHRPRGPRPRARPTPTRGIPCSTAVRRWPHVARRPRGPENRRRVILQQQPTRERLEGVRRTGRVSGSVQQLDEPCEGGFVVEIERDSLARRARRGREIAVPLGALRHLRRRSSRQPTQAQALALDPALELRGSIVDEKAGEEVTAIELERSCRFPSVTRLLERERVKPQRRWLEADFFVTVTIEDAVAQLATEKPQRLAQRPTGVRRVELGPKQRNDGIAAGTGSVNGEIGEKGEALRLSEDRADRASVGPLQV